MLGNCASHELSLASGAPDGHRVPASPNAGWWPCQQGSYATSGFEHQVAVVSRDLACNPRPRNNGPARRQSGAAKSWFEHQVAVVSRDLAYKPRPRNNGPARRQSGAAKSWFERPVGLRPAAGNPTAPATLSPGTPFPTRIAQPWGYSSAQGHCPNPCLYPYPSSIRVETDGSDQRGHTTGERPRP